MNQKQESHADKRTQLENELALAEGVIDKASCTIRIAIQCDQTGDYRAAIAYANDAIHILGCFEKDGKIVFPSLSQSSSERSEYTQLAAASYRTLASCCLNTGMLNEAQQYFAFALELAETGTDRRLLMNILHGLTALHLTKTDTKRAFELIRRAIEIAVQAQDNEYEAVSLKWLATCYANVGDHTSSLDICKRALTLFEHQGDVVNEAGIYLMIGRSNYSLGDNHHALDNLLRAEELLVKNGYRKKAVFLYTYMGATYTTLGDFQNALDYCQKGLTLSEEVGNVFGIASASKQLGIVYGEMRDYKGAIYWFERGLSLFDQLGNKLETANTLGNIGVTYHNMGQQDTALSTLTQALSLSEELGNSPQISYWLSEIGNVLRALERYSESLGYFQRSIHILWDLKSEDGLAAALISQGFALLELDRKKEGENAIRKGLSIAESTGDKIQQARACNILSQLDESVDPVTALELYKRFHDLENENQSIEVKKSLELLKAQIKYNEQQSELEIQRLKTEHLEHEMKRTQEELSNRTLQMVQQTEMIQNFRRELETIVRQADTAEKAVRSIQKKLKEVPESVVNWQKFEGDFQKVHPQFQIALRAQFPNLTTMQHKICCLLRIGMHSPEIATLLFLSDRTVENHRYNLRKKLKLRNGQDIMDVLGAM